MELVAAYPIVVTDKLGECREFHARWFGLEAIFEADWIAVLSAGGGVPAIAFMHSRHPSTPPSPGPYEGDGMLLTLQVADAAAEFERLASAGTAVRPRAEGRAVGAAPLRSGRSLGDVGGRGGADRACPRLVGAVPVLGHVRHHPGRRRAAADQAKREARDREPVSAAAGRGSRAARSASTPGRTGAPPRRRRAAARPSRARPAGGAGRPSPRRRCPSRARHGRGASGCRRR